jgi:competence ComEA-like helix-hairpin-helix protein
MTIFNFTTQEIRAILLLLVALLVGSGITLYKRTHPQFASELVMEKAGLTPVGNLQTTAPPPAGRQIPKGSDQPPKRVRININQATAEELESVPGLGPKLSQRIVEYRNIHGSFHKLEDLVNVSGIGPKNLEKIQDHLVVE